MPSDRELSHLYPVFRASFEAVLSGLKAWLDAHRPGYTAFMVEGFRSAAYQNELWRKGRFTKPLGKQYVVTQRDGFIRKSNHQSSLAADIAFRDPKGKVVFSIDQETWDYYGHLIRLHKLEWGGDWKSFVDRPHCEWPAADRETYKIASTWQKKAGLR